MISLIVLLKELLRENFSNRLDYLERTNNKMFYRFEISKASSTNQVWEITTNIHITLVFFS